MTFEQTAQVFATIAARLDALEKKVAALEAERRPGLMQKLGAAIRVQFRGAK